MNEEFYNRVTNFFIKDNENLPSEKQYKNRSLVLSMVISTITIFMLVVLENLGFYEDSVVFPVLIMCVFSLILMKFSGKIETVIWINVIASTIFVIYDVFINGGVYSFHNKWFALILIFLYFTLTRFITAYTVFIIVVQIGIYYFVSPDLIFEELGTRQGAFFSTLVYFIILYCLLLSDQKYDNLLTRRIENQNQKLLAQKQELLAQKQELLVQKQDLVKNNLLLEEKTKQLLLSNQELERFAYIASHDLKTPLNNIISFSLLLKKELKDIVNPKVHQYFGFIQDGSVKMNQLIKDVLEYSKLSATVVDEELIDLNELVNEIKISISEYINERNAIIKVNNTLPTIKSNHAKMYLLFKNLIENGIKYNESFIPTVEIDVKKEAEYYLFIIADNGIGINEEFHASIFNMFSRLHNSSQYEGTGLGLSLSKKIVEGLSGSIYVESETSSILKNRGTKFIVQLHEKHFIKPVQKHLKSTKPSPLIVEH